ncbi:MAG TPA: YidB family protein [Terracidiphilus sp.]|jgi:uncharacterized protein YidB (DUF937 family)
MGILNTVQSMAAGPAAGTHQKVASALMEELGQTTSGTPGLIQSFQRNGMGAHVEQWMQGNIQPNSTAIENGLADTSLIERIAERTGLSHGTVRGALALIVPVLIHHVVSNGYVSTTGEVLKPQTESGSVLQSILPRIV